MAITAQRLLSDSRAEIVQTAAGDWERTWIIRVNSVEDTEDGLYQSGALPLIGSSLNGNPQMTLRSYSVDRVGKFTFKIVGKYSSKNETQAEREARLREEFPVPWWEPPRITLPVVEYADEPLKDKDGVAFTNSFGTPYTTVPPRRRFKPIVRVKTNVASIPSWYYTLGVGVRNADAVTVRLKTGPLPTFPAETLLFVPKDIPEYKMRGPYVFHELEFDLEYDPNRWEIELVDMGPRYLNDDEKEADFPDGMGFLDSTGHEGDPDLPATNTFHYYETASFADLPLTEF